MFSFETVERQPMPQFFREDYMVLYGGWGYNEKVHSEGKFLERFSSLTMAIRKLPQMTGYCFTQFTDVENEQNCLVTINREPKADIQKIRKINLGTVK